jgi:hypothetical protein
MEFTYNTIKYNVQIVNLDVIISAVDTTTLQQYTGTARSDILDVNGVYKVICDGFRQLISDGYSKSTLDIETCETSINLSFTVQSYIFTTNINVTLSQITSISEVEVLKNRVNWLSGNLAVSRDEVSALRRELKGLRSNLSDILRFLPWLKYSSNYIMSGEVLNPNVNRIHFNGTLIVNGEGQKCNYVCNAGQLKALLSLYQPLELVLTGNGVINHILTAFIDSEIGDIESMRTLTTLFINNVPITTVRSILQLPKLTKLTLRNCIGVRDLDRVYLMDTLETLEITADMVRPTLPSGARVKVVII